MFDLFACFRLLIWFVKCVFFLGCDNITNSGMETNPCGYCISSDTDDFETYGTDCRGEGYCDDGTYGYDTCGNCLWVGSSDWDNCSESSTSSTSAATRTWEWIIGVVVVLGFIVCGFIIFKMYKKQQQTQDAFENILKTYNLMDENPSQKSQAREGRTRKKKERVPQNDDELDVEDETTIA